jgi:putative membrane protein
MLWIKAFHIIFLIAWFAGLFYLPRLFVYHAMSSDEISNERFKIMERKLYYGIMAPGAVLTILFGAWLIFYDLDYYRQAGWMLAKLICVAFLIIFHLYCGKLRNDFRLNRNQHGHVFYRWLNEVPTVLLIAIVILAFVHPF